ncbi:MAG: C40 family peptidase [Spirochaetes bacterium]|jgi:cell wall-associated NlpC family hydrolase|nr:C40 family peptidase [Spirochaetota bacterium]
MRIIRLLFTFLIIVINFEVVSQNSSDSIQEDTSFLTDNSLLIPENQQIIRQNLISEAKKHIGLLYRYGGNSPKGFDCSGFTQYLYKKQGIKLPRSSKNQYESGEKIEIETILPGDLLFFFIKKPGVISHVAMYIGNGNFIHSPSRGKRIMISSITNDNYWIKRYIGTATFLE